MPNKKARKDCPICGTRGGMVFEARDNPVEYKGHKRSHVITTWWCTHCEEGVLEPEMAAEDERLFVALRAEIEDVLLPEQVAAIRAKLGISQREAGRILGGGTRAFQKYESGETPVSEPMRNLLVLLGNEPKRLSELVREPAPKRARQQRASKSVTREAIAKPLRVRPRSSSESQRAAARGSR
ncbi:MAG TPA: type II toxin-antitoxin system MqsA family antitoxin [Polyangiaceae bacterium]|nr:type II toxin-antitoxin system MqsA family antitoxin [Polyangiaceae bacterium]